MKARLLIALVCSALLGGGFVFASEVGNNPEGTGWRLDLGYEQSTTEVELEDPGLLYEYVDTWEESPDYYGSYTEQGWMESFDGRETLDKYFLKAAYGFSERYVVYFKLGMARMNARQYDPIMRWTWEDYEYDMGDEYLYYDYETETVNSTQGVGDWDPFYGAGFKAVFHDAGGFKIGMDLQWNQYKLDADVYQYLDFYDYGDGPLGDPYYYYSELDSHRLLETDTTEYQLALVMSKHNEHFSPYGGLKLSQWETDHSGQGFYGETGYDRQYDYEESWDWTYTTKATGNIGMFFGADYAMSGNFMLSGEIQVGDQNAATIRLSWKF